VSEEINFKYHGISGNIFTDDDIDIVDQVFEMVNQYFINKYDDGISRAEFIEEDIEVYDAWDISAQWIEEDKKENPQRYKEVSSE